MLRKILILFFLAGCQSAMLVSGPSNLQVAEVFGDHMVLQRGREIPVWGKAAPGTRVTVTLGDTTVDALADSAGHWEARLPEQSAGYAATLSIAAHDETLAFTDVLLGEVWLASGQSNMHLDMSRTLNGPEVAQAANNPNIRVFDMKPTFPTGPDGVHTPEELKVINEDRYFGIEGWVPITPARSAYLSAVVYYFAEKLHGELDVPIGVIHNAVPGSPTESWLSREVLEKDERLSPFVHTRWQDNEKNGVGKILIDIAEHQVSLSDDPMQKHPWMPMYNYRNGIKPIEGFAMTGVIWYQGESNSDRPEQHATLLKSMVKSWRDAWNLDSFPFYFVQLSSREDRAVWPEFRDSQRRLVEEIPNSGMVVTSDVGDRQDTHAKRKKPVGERLAMLALGKTYGKTDVYESPLFDGLAIRESHAYISFKGNTEGLKTSDGEEVRGFEIGDGTIFVGADAEIVGEQIRIALPEDLAGNIVVRYAWQPYSEANLVNGIGLPASTFRSN